MKGRIICARTAKPNSEKRVLQRVTQIHTMFSRDDVCTGGGAARSALRTKATPTFTASPAHCKHVPRVPCSPCSETQSLSAAVIGINKINRRSRGCLSLQWGGGGAGKRMMERKRKETVTKPACAQFPSLRSNELQSFKKAFVGKGKSVFPDSSRTESRSLTLDLLLSIAFSLYCLLFKRKKGKEERRECL